ncbi:MAG: hypothetical protein EOP54_14125 [Sphingobacteriales bacterium]|nr:MAG: hypothetical protein EOP54_14125 [Sphingobacteriales bacterium]
MDQKKYSFFKRNGLSIVLLSLMLIALIGQVVTGFFTKNKEMAEDGLRELSMTQYLQSGHFMQATFENWESEFLQMALYVLLTIRLFQAGSSESKDPDKEEAVDREPEPKPGAPWPVRKGGIWLKLYSNSLSLTFVLLFLISFYLHFLGSLKDNNETLSAKGAPPDTWQKYLGAPRFWFESFQNWQSEFVAVAAIVILSIWLRQKGSPESKPVDAPHSQTGD